MRSDIPTYKCIKCKVDMKPHDAPQTNGRLHGWTCPRCNHFEKAIGRERLYQCQSNEQ